MWGWVSKAIFHARSLLVARCDGRTEASVRKREKTELRKRLGEGVRMRQVHTPAAVMHVYGGWCFIFGSRDRRAQRGDSALPRHRPPLLPTVCTSNPNFGPGRACGDQSALASFANLLAMLVFDTEAANVCPGVSITRSVAPAPSSSLNLAHDAMPHQHAGPCRRRDLDRARDGTLSSASDQLMRHPHTNFSTRCIAT